MTGLVVVTHGGLVVAVKGAIVVVDVVDVVDVEVGVNVELVVWNGNGK